MSYFQCNFNNMLINKEKRGGKREGSGRPSLTYKTVIYKKTVPSNLLDQVKQLVQAFLNSNK